MGMPINLRREIIGSILNFAQAGVMTDDGQGGEIAISPTVKPAADSGDWDNLGRTVSCKPTSDTTTDGEVSFNPVTRKYEKTEEIIVLADYLDVVVRDHQALIWKLVFGIEGDVPSDGSPIIPFAEDIRKVEGWLQFQAVATKDNISRSIMDLWIEMTLKNYPGWTEKATLPELRLKVISSTLNTGVFSGNI